jgi:hypothetical protein
MKIGTLLVVLFVAGCGSSQAPSQTQTTSAAVTADPAQNAPTTAEKWAEAKVAADAKNAKSSGTAEKVSDPLAMNDALEDSAIPKVEMTPAREVRGKGRWDLDAGMALLKSASSLEGAVKKLNSRLGKPSWTENGSKRIWVANAGAQCHRLVLEPDGTAEIEIASKTEWRSLTATAKQNPCTGEIKRGIGK